MTCPHCGDPVGLLGWDAHVEAYPGGDRWLCESAPLSDRDLGDEDDRPPFGTTADELEAQAARMWGCI